ncbi:MAG TPA: hypothetical protein VGL83_20525 [Stellaceae bacterium]|jgi:hypothetical protein
MIHHASLPARDPRRVATVLAELLGGRAYRFPLLEGAFQVVSGDADGTMIEIYPAGVQLEPESGFVQAGQTAAYHPFHLLLSVPLAAAEIERIGTREGWHCDASVAGLPGRLPASLSALDRESYAGRMRAGSDDRRISPLYAVRHSRCDSGLRARAWRA